MNEMKTGMTQELMKYSTDPSKAIRTVMIDGEPWFVGKDVCEAFGDTNYRRSLRNLDADEKGVSQNEEQVNARIEQLNAFRRWVTHDVLHSIRKYGVYFSKEHKPPHFHPVQDGICGGFAFLEIRCIEKQ